MGAVLGVLVAVAVTIVVVPPASAASPKDKLEDARERLEQVRARLDDVTVRCESNQERVARVNGRVERTLTAVREAELAVDGQRRVADHAQQRLEQLEQQASAARDVSTRRVVEMYKNGVADPALPSLLTASSTEQVLSRAQVLNVVAHGDREALEQLSASQTTVSAQQQLLERQQRSYETALRDRRALVDELEEVRATYQRKIARCNTAVVRLEQQERIAADDESELTAALAERGPVSVPPSASAGGWAWPAGGPVTSPFGPRWGRLHAGIDVGSPSGAPIYAAKGGVVSYAGVMGGYGNIIVIDHGEGMTTRYAHQSQLAANVGQTVNAGDQIGYVGATGNVTGPHLHFEVRVNDQPQDPGGYLP